MLQLEALGGNGCFNVMEDRARKDFERLANSFPVQSQDHLHKPVKYSSWGGYNPWVRM